MAPLPQEAVDTVIVGNGPAALILSYILHGHIPYYKGGLNDHLIESKLHKSPDLTHLSPNIYNLTRSSSRYSSQALPVNALLDGLIRPNGDTEIDSKSCIEWSYEPEKAVSHVVLGNAPCAGGQWADNPVKASGEIGTLSYAEQLNLPGFSFADYWQKAEREPLVEFLRPTRNKVAGYLKTYPAAVHIDDTVYTSSHVSKIRKVAGGFYIEPFGTFCKHLVLATGVFNVNLPAPNFLNPLRSLHSHEGPLLVIGSGFTAADIIISTPPSQSIIHLFNWDPINNPSPLKACHGSAYPEYAWIYRQMKLAAGKHKSKQAKAPPVSSTPYVSERNWAETYEGFPNSRVISMYVHKSQQGVPCATVEMGRFSQGATVTRSIASFDYATGRRGSLEYLDPWLLQQVLPSKQPDSTFTSHNPSLYERPNNTPASNGIWPAIPDPHDCPPHGRPEQPKHRDFASEAGIRESAIVNRQTLRVKIEQEAEAAENKDHDTEMQSGRTASPATAAGLEVAPDVFVVGSITGDTLIRFAYGGCAVVAGTLLQRSKSA